MLYCNVVIAVYDNFGGIRRVTKLRVEDELTKRYREGKGTPNVGYVLKSGDVVIDKKSDEESIILFINKKQKQKKHGI